MMKLPIFDLENWREIVATLSRNKTRTFLTAFGIFWGTAMLSMLSGGAKGMEDMLRRNFEGFATNTAFMFTMRRTVPYQGMVKGSRWNMDAADIENLRRSIPEIEAVSVSNSYGSVRVVCGRRSTTTSLQGADEYYSKVMEPVIYEGRFISANDQRNSRKVCVLGKRVAQELFPGESPIGKYVSAHGVYYAVVGVAGQIGEATMNARIDESMFIPFSTMALAYNLGSNIGGAAIVVKDGYTPSAIKSAVRRIVTRNHKVAPEDDNALGFFDISEQFAMIDNIFMGITLLALFVGIGSLMAGIIGVGNIMWVIVKERTQEIGIRRAIGAKPRDIIVQILSEGMLLTMVAGMMGICFAVLVLAVAQQVTAAADGSLAGFQLSFAKAVQVVALFVVLGTLAGIIPSYKAMKIKPVEAINDK